MLDMYILKTGNKMQGKILTKCRFYKKNIYKNLSTTPKAVMVCCIVSRGCGLDPKIKVISLFKNKKKKVFFKKICRLIHSSKNVGFLFCSIRHCDVGLSLGTEILTDSSEWKQGNTEFMVRWCNKMSFPETES